MFNLFTQAEAEITDVIMQLAIVPIGVLASGVIAIATPLLVMWTLYRAYLIMAGLSPEPLMTTMKDLMVKGAIIIMAGSSIFLTNSLLKPLVDTQESLASEIQQGKSGPILGKIESNITQVTVLLQAAITAETVPVNKADELTAQNNYEPMNMFAWGVANLHGLWEGATGKLETVMAIIGEIIRFSMVLIGLACIGISAFTAIIINKIFFMLSLGFAPLFIFFLAFDMTKGWFSSWLNTTLGYCLSYPVIVLGVSILLQIYDQILQQETLTFIEATACLLGGILFSLLISRLGDIASSWFSASNISDGTALAMAAAAKSTGKTSAKIGASGIKGAGAGLKATGRGVAATGRGTLATARGVRRLVNRINIKENK